MSPSQKPAEIFVPEFDLRQTLESGQIFHAMPTGPGWQVLVDRTPLYVEQQDRVLRVTAGHESLAQNYLSLDHPLESIYAAFPSDPFSRAALQSCGLGFRAKSLLATARTVASQEVDLAALAQWPTGKLRDRLCEFPGVGRKVANCVLLFAYERLDAVPVDVWIARILLAMRRRKSSHLELERYSNRRFGAYAGYVQQYLFHHARMTKSLPAT